MTDISGAFDRVDTFMAQHHAGGASPGLSYGVVHGDLLVHTGGLGLSRLHETGSTPGPDTVFRIASMSKSFTAAAVLMLRDAGLVRLDAPIADYVPELRNLVLPTTDSVLPTVRDVLTMSAGFATDDPWADREESMSPSEYSSLLTAGFTFDEAPGTAYDYSNLGYTMLGRVISNASSLPFQEFVSSRILAPLGMTSSGYSVADISLPHLAEGYFRFDEDWQVEPTASTGEFAALGGLFSTVRDLSRWVSVLAGAFPARDGHDPAIPMSRASLREMQQGVRFVRANSGIVVGPQPISGEMSSYGFGLVVTIDQRFGPIVSHAGGYPGYGSHMIWHPASGVGVISLANGRYADSARQAGPRSLNALLAEIDAPARSVRLTSATLAAHATIDDLLDQWDDTVADSIFAANVDSDYPRDRRRGDVASAVSEVGGLTGPAFDVSAMTPSNISWWRPARSGRLRVEIYLTPQASQLVQTLIARAVPDPTPELVAIAHSVVSSLWSLVPAWPSGVPRAESVDVPALVSAAATARAALVTGLVSPLPTEATSATSATFALTGSAVRSALMITWDSASGEVTACSLTTTADDWAASRRIVG